MLYSVVLGRHRCNAQLRLLSGSTLLWNSMSLSTNVYQVYADSRHQLAAVGKCGKFTEGVTPAVLKS